MSTTPNENSPWDTEVNFAITICDQDGKILQMNEKSKATFLKGKEMSLIGKSVLDCHPPAAKEKLSSLLQTHETNAYTIEKNNQKKLIYQTPWYENGEFRGLVELSLVLPNDMQHYKRKN